MVVNCSTEAKDFDETLHVLKNASIARSVSVAQKESRVNSWRSLASLTKYGLNGRRRKRPAEESADELRAKPLVAHNVMQTNAEENVKENLVR